MPTYMYMYSIDLLFILCCVHLGLVDVDTGSVRKGVELLPLRNKIFSGWYNHVAIRRLTGLTDEQRRQLHDKMLEVCNTYV